jgi:arylsulfatase A-like enzyme
MELDHGVGLILNKLRELNIQDNTFVFFSSDNGAATYAFTEGNYYYNIIVSLIKPGFPLIGSGCPFTKGCCSKILPNY